MSESNRYAKYKPDNAATSARDICPADALTLNDVQSIEARGQYRDAIDSHLTGPLSERNANHYKIESLTEADALVEACDLVLHGDAETDGANLPTSTRKAVHRVKTEAKEVARGLRAAVDELNTTRDYPEARRNAERKRRRLRADGGTKQRTFGNVHIEAVHVGTCDQVMKVYNGERVTCDNSARWRVDYPDGETRRFCGVHKGDVEVLL